MNTKTVLWIVGIVAVLLAGAWLNPVVIIPEGNIGVVYNLGKASDSVLGPGFHTRCDGSLDDAGPGGVHQVESLERNSSANRDRW